MFDRLLRWTVVATFLIAATPANAANEEFPVPVGFTGAYRSIDGINLHYVSGGSGPLVLLVHGFGQTWYEWHHLMPLLQKDHTVVAIDLPGLGYSGAPRSYAGQDVAELIYRLAKTFSPDRPFDLVAHDIGIWNTYPMAVGHQPDIRRLVFMEAPIPDDRIYTFPAFTPNGESLVWHFSFFAAGDRLPETLVAGKEHLFFDHFIKEHAANKAAFSPDDIDLYARSYAKPGALHSAFEYYRSLNETVRRNKPLQQGKLTMPVLAIGGGGSGGLALLWQIMFGCQIETHPTMRASLRWRSCEEVEDGLPDGRHARLWRWSPDSFFSAPLP